MTNPITPMRAESIVETAVQQIKALAEALQDADPSDYSTEKAWDNYRLATEPDAVRALCDAVLAGGTDAAKPAGAGGVAVRETTADDAQRFLSEFDDIQKVAHCSVCAAWTAMTNLHMRIAASSDTPAQGTERGEVYITHNGAVIGKAAHDIAGYAASPTPAIPAALPVEARPVATLHADGHWTSKPGSPHEYASNFAGWRMDVYEHPSPASPAKGDGNDRAVASTARTDAADMIVELRTKLQNLIAELPDTRRLLIARTDAEASLKISKSDTQKDADVEGRRGRSGEG